ncbi:MAG: hypothetical protein ACT4NP_15380 [Pseudonocardiales bacterium]
MSTSPEVSRPPTRSQKRPLIIVRWTGSSVALLVTTADGEFSPLLPLTRATLTVPVEHTL